MFGHVDSAPALRTPSSRVSSLRPSSPAVATDVAIRLEGQLEAAQERLAALQHARRVLSLDSPVGLLTAVRRTTQPDGYAAEAALTQFADEPGVRKLIGALALERRRLATEIEARLKLIQCTRSGEDALIQIEAEPILYRKWAWRPMALAVCLASLGFVFYAHDGHASFAVWSRALLPLWLLASFLRPRRVSVTAAALIIGAQTFRFSDISANRHHLPGVRITLRSQVRPVGHFFLPRAVCYLLASRGVRIE